VLHGQGVWFLKHSGNNVLTGQRHVGPAAPSSWHILTHVCLRPLRPVLSAWHEMPGHAAPDSLRPVRAVLSRTQRVRCDAGVRQRALDAPWHDCVAIAPRLCVPLCLCVSKPIPPRRGRWRVVAGAVSENCPYRACIFVGGRTRGCTPGWWNWPYRPKSQRAVGRGQWAVGGGQWAVRSEKWEVGVGGRKWQAEGCMQQFSCVCGL
jgi:hypothetical protein